jgi:hypothetical protein
VTPPRDSMEVWGGCGRSDARTSLAASVFFVALALSGAVLSLALAWSAWR